MTVLVFPNNPTEGQVYPPEPIPGVNQYFWDSETETWIQLPACPTPEGVTLIDTGTGLTGGPIAYQGIIEIADTGVVAGSYTNANITVNAQGQITEAENGSSNSIQTETFTTGVLPPGGTEEFEIDCGVLFSLASLSVTASSEDSWVRIYTSDAARQADTRVVPGPPFPTLDFAAEIVTTSSQPSVTFLPVPSIYAENGLFLRLTNQSLLSQSFTLDINYLQSV